MWIDNHTHINMLEISTDEAIRTAKDAKLERCINIGTHPNDLELVYETSKKFFPLIQCTLGLHPHDAKFYDVKIETIIRTLGKCKEMIGVGEIGLDYYYSHSPHDVQKSVFEKQMQIAKDLDLPVEIHTRDAEFDTIEILKKFPTVKGVIHCFTGSQWLADEALKLGYNISVSGIVTFPKSTELQNVIRTIPLERLHIETDAPFLSPVPMRGKKNIPAYLAYTAAYIAKMRQVSEEELAKQIWSNTVKLFPKFK